MAIGKNLLKENTNVGVRATVSLNAPGNYKAPYGKSVVTVGGRGATGNPGNPGNPNVPGNFVPGNYVPGGPTTYVTFNVTFSGPRFQRPATNTFVTAPGPSPRYNSGFCGYFGATYTATANYATFYNVGAFTNPGSSNPSVPGNVGAAGNAASGATIGGVFFPGGAGGNAGAIAGAGGAGVVAPTVSPTATTIEYSEAGISVTVPTGGYVDFNNL